jgi:membrane-associated phospholipid phosphatase
LPAVLERLDTELLRLLRTRAHGERTERWMVAYSRTGEHGFLWLAVAAVGATTASRGRRHYRRAFGTVALTYVLTQAAKVATRRARPLLDDLPRLSSTLSNRSYPSAHASTAFAGARSLSAVLPAAPLYAAATLMAASRPYVGVHYPSDVVAGAAFGAAVAELALR